MKIIVTCAMCSNELETWFDFDECDPGEIRAVAEPCSRCENERIRDSAHSPYTPPEIEGQSAPSDSSVDDQKDTGIEPIPYTGQGSRLPQGSGNME